MALTLRNEKGSMLSYDEPSSNVTTSQSDGDSNFIIQPASEVGIVSNDPPACDWLFDIGEKSYKLQ